MNLSLAARPRKGCHTAVSHWKFGLKWKLGLHYCVIVVENGLHKIQSGDY